ncbi:C-type mannose receptor 2-like [Ambystoma mexicanum]|uniref:C-type mannose receptor 2-like n=1 Tax=Ambystoma mexicanum TaxID=8296 RepID=UPI0037E8098A
MGPAVQLLACCVALCATGAHAAREYFYIQTHKSWTEARKFCRANYKELAFMSNNAEFNAVKNKISQWPTTAWIGLYRCNVTQWLWSNGIDDDFRRWYQMPDDNIDRSCAKMEAGDGSTWNEDRCHEQRNFICYQDANESQGPYEFPSSCEAYVYPQRFTVATTTKSTTTTARTTTRTTTLQTNPASQTTKLDTTTSTRPPTSMSIGDPASRTATSLGTTGHSPWTNTSTSLPSKAAQGSSPQSAWAMALTTAAGNCSSCSLHLIPERMSWSEARKHCISVYTDLASIPVAEVQWRVSRLLLATDTASGVWIGLRRSRVWGHWYWVNEDPSDFNYWGKGELSNPLSGRCAMVSRMPGRNYTWQNECCGVRLPSICYSKMNHPGL